MGTILEYRTLAGIESRLLPVLWGEYIYIPHNRGPNPLGPWPWPLAAFCKKLANNASTVEILPLGRTIDTILLLGGYSSEIRKYSHQPAEITPRIHNVVTPFHHYCPTGNRTQMEYLRTQYGYARNET